MWSSVLLVAALAYAPACAEPPQPKNPSRLVAKPVVDQRRSKPPRRITKAVSAHAIEVPADLSGTDVEDRLEPANRVFFGINEAVDRVVLEPVARVYRVVVPRPLRRGVANVLQNAGAPVVLANDLLQGDADRASQTMVRFMINTTIGMGGLMDFAADAGIPHHGEDFGQTLAVWGVGSGPYMVSPLLGPGNPRDFAGRAVDIAFNPLTWLLIDEPFGIRAAPGAASVISNREAVLDEVARLRETSPDFYVTVRDLYLQKRQSEISNGDFAGDPIPDMSGVSDITGIPLISDMVTPN